MGIAGSPHRQLVPPPPTKGAGSTPAPITPAGGCILSRSDYLATTDSARHDDPVKSLSFASPPPKLHPGGQWPSSTELPEHSVSSKAGDHARAKWSPGGAGSVITAAAATSSSPLPCFDPATPAMPRAPVDGAAARAHKAARRLPSTQGSGAEAPSKDAAVPVAACGVQSATQQSLISLDERGFGLTALSDQQGMQLDAAFAAAIGGDDGAAESEQQLPLCVMRPVVNLPYRGKMAAEATVAAKPRQGHQASDVARAPAPGRRSALQGLPGPAVVSLGALSGKAAEQATAAHRAATPAPSLLDQLCAEIEHAGTSGNGAAAMEVGPPCKTSPTVIGTPLIRQLFAAVTPTAPLKAARPQAVAASHGDSPSFKVKSCLQQLVDAHGL